MMKISIIHSVLFLFSCLIIRVSVADENMKFHGALVNPPACTINDNQPINVEFGNVGVNKIDGVNYTQDVDYQITCDDEDEGSDLYLSLMGDVTSYDAAAIATNVNGLGIEIKEGGKAFDLNSQVKVDASSPPKLTAVPVKKDNAELSVGEFSATATLKAFYQ